MQKIFDNRKTKHILQRIDNCNTIDELEKIEPFSYYNVYYIYVDGEAKPYKFINPVHIGRHYLIENSIQVVCEDDKGDRCSIIFLSEKIIEIREEQLYIVVEQDMWNVKYGELCRKENEGLILDDDFDRSEINYD